MTNWITPLDACAAGGVLDYDAAAYLIDQPARFVGHPQLESLPSTETPLLLPPNTKIKGELKEDCFGAPSSLINNPSWKKWLFGGLIAGGIGFLALGKLGKLGKIFKPKAATASVGTTAAGAGSKIKMPDFSKFGTAIKNFAKKIWGYIKKPFEFIIGKFKK